ncbi:MAG: hypothetical protein ABI867_34735 [Kofleriaceae bacterium]
MTFEPGTPLAPNQLSAAAQRVLGPGPGRSMAARGLMPLAPGDQLVVLYTLAHDADTALAASARATAMGLPEKLLAGTLVDAQLDPRLLDFFGQLGAEKPAVFDAVILNPATTDLTIAALATKAGPREIDLISQNEQALLRHPEIIAAMYMNRRARMSTIDRVVELAVRNNVRVPGLAAWDEVARALTGEPMAAVDDELFAAVVRDRDDSDLTVGDADRSIFDDEEGREAARTTKLLELHLSRTGQPTIRAPLKRARTTFGSAATVDIRLPDVPGQWIAVDVDDDGADIHTARGEKLRLGLNAMIDVDGFRLSVTPLPFRDLPIPAKIRAATIGDAFVRSEAIRDPLKMVAMAAIKSPGVTEIEACRYAGNQVLPEDVIRYIATKREWTKMYGVKVALCRNPKTPISETTRMLPFLREKDLHRITKSKGVPSAVVAQARKLQITRGGKK